MSKSSVDISTLVQAYNDHKLTTFQKRIDTIRSSERGKTILEYFNKFICPGETTRYNSNQTSYYNQVYGSVGNRTQEEIFAARELKKFDPYVLYSIKEAVEQGVIKQELLGQSDFFVDMVDLAEQEMQRFDEIGKTPNQRQVNSILKKALVDAKSKAIREDQAESIGNKMSQEKAGELLTEYALNIPIQPKTHNGFLTSREQIMIALFKAYRDENSYGVLGVKINETNDKKEEVLRVVLNKDSRGQYNGKEDDVTQDDITAVSRVSAALKQIKKQHDVTPLQVIAMADDLIERANVIREQVGRKELSLSQVLPADVTSVLVKDMLEKTNKKQIGKEDYGKLAYSQRTGFLAKVGDVIRRVLGRDDRNNRDIQK